MKILLLKLYAAALTVVSTVTATAHAAELHVMSSGDFMVAYKVLESKLAAQTGSLLNTAFGPSMGKSSEAIPNRLARSEPADAVITVGYTLDDLIKQDKVTPESRMELADSRIGMVVREDATKPDISPPEALRHVLLHAGSIVYSDSASGVCIERELFKKLGIEERVKARAKVIPRTPVTPVVATGDYEVGFQQVNELLPVPGATFIGGIPESPQPVTRCVTGILIGAQHLKEAKALPGYLASSAAQIDVRSTGLDSMPGQ